MTNKEFEEQKKVANQLFSGQPRSFELYARINECTCLLVPVAYQSMALADGYKAALNYHQIYSEQQRIEEGQLLAHLQTILEDSLTISAIKKYDPVFIENCRAIMENGSDMVSYNFIGYIKIAFIHGYKLGLHDAHIYDDCLFLKGDELLDGVFTSLFSLKERQAKKRQVQAEIIAKKYGTDRDQTHNTIVSPVPHIVDSEGNRVGLASIDGKLYAM